MRELLVLRVAVVISVVVIEVCVILLEVGITVLTCLIFCMKIFLLRLLLVCYVVFKPSGTLIPILLGKWTHDISAIGLLMLQATLGTNLFIFLN